MEIRTIKKYSKINLGYYLDKPEPVTGGYDRAITLIDGANDSRYAGASYTADDWFIYLAGYSTNKSTFITLNPNSVNKCLKANSRLDDDILKRYGYRVLFADLILNYKELGDEVGKELLNEELADRVKELFETKREAYKRIFEVINEEYEPLYNLDVTYEEQHSGTDTTGSSGSNTSSLTRTGDDSLKRTGTEKLTNAGSEAMTYAGSEKTAYSGSESMTYAGSEITTYAGSESMSYAGTESTTYAGAEITADGTGSKTVTNNSVYAFNSADPVPESHSETLHEKSESKTYDDREDTKSFNNREDTKSYDDREDTKSYDDREDTKSFNNREDTKSYQNRTDTKSFNNREDTTTYNTTDKTEYNSGQSTSGTHTDTGSYTHGEKIVTKRYGNQGITKSTELLIDQINTWTNIDFIHYVADEIVRKISTV